MHVFLEFDWQLFCWLFLLAGMTGLAVMVDRWVFGDALHPTHDNGVLNKNKSFWMYVLTFIMSGLSGLMVSIGTGYFLEHTDVVIMSFTAIMIGAIGRNIFYKLVDWVQVKLDEVLTPKKSYRTGSSNDKNNRRGR